MPCVRPPLVYVQYCEHEKARRRARRIRVSVCHHYQSLVWAITTGGVARFRDFVVRFALL